MNIEVRWRFKGDESNRPDFEEVMMDWQVAEFEVEIKEAGGEILDRREVHWTEMLASMENGGEL